jgi:hypothetical protein
MKKIRVTREWHTLLFDYPKIPKFSTTVSSAYFSLQAEQIRNSISLDSRDAI